MASADEFPLKMFGKNLETSNYYSQELKCEV